MSAILGAPELNWNVDDVNGGGTITLHEYADGKNGAVVAKMAGTDEKAVALAVLLSEAPALLAALEKMVTDLDELIANSGGVYGLHMNGEGAPWESLTEGGEFGAWLCSLETARAALAKAKGETK